MAILVDINIKGMPDAVYMLEAWGMCAVSIFRI